MAELNPLHLAALTDALNRSPYFSLLGFRIRALGQDCAVVEMALDPARHMNPFGTAHGGVYASLLDTAAYWAAYCGMDEQSGFTTLDLNMNCLRMTLSGRLTAAGRCVKAGRSICLCEAELRDEQNRLLATASSKLMVLQGRMSIRDLMQAQGVTLPPKFC